MQPGHRQLDFSGGVEVVAILDADSDKVLIVYADGSDCVWHRNADLPIIAA